MPKFGDTPRFDGRSLCETCRSGQITTGLRSKDSLVLCRLGHNDAIPMPQPVTTCSDYDDKRIAPLWEMEKIAYRFSVDNRRKHAGFISPAEFKRRVKDGTEVDD